ncbi:hypothetical protein FBEOM_519 [Fusarium beomiforme]|uniref:Uncharacterized protein n=1 Tax=Fusarium beomiforme TaxID=44412 RepID=A0A9P5E5Z0_9HYPO|nr:hypothetical protein FBEOM_519 [Fusarium beomiforme]
MLLRFVASNTFQILLELKAVVQYFCNTVDGEVNNISSMLRSLVDVLANRCVTSPSNPVGVTPKLQAQELAIGREYLALIYLVLAGAERHTDDEINANIAGIISLCTRECSEVEAFTSALNRLPLAYSTPLTHEIPTEKAKWPKELPSNFVALMNRWIEEGKPVPRIVIRFAG